MKEDVKKLCDDILRYGKIGSDKEFKCDNDMVRQYKVEYDGEKYLMTKVNGEWKQVYKIVETSKGVYYKIIE